MVDITKLKKKNIAANGYYFGLEDGLGNFSLSDEEIREARAYFQDSSIACHRQLDKRYKVTDKQTYNNGKHHKKGRINNNRRIPIMIGGALLTITFLGSSAFLTAQVKNSFVQTETDAMLESTNYEQTETSAFSKNNIAGIVDSYLISTGGEKNILSEESTPIEKRRELVKKYCEIFQVDYEITYEKLYELSDHFTSTDYFNGYIPGLTCKGEEVHATSEEALIIYFVRCVKQMPEQLGITVNPSADTDYQSSDNYAEAIGYYASVFGVDPCLVYAIAQTETSWNSELFLNSNNPAGLQLNGDWWRFSSKEEGFIELILEILKYNQLGAYTISEIGKIHAPQEDGNENWVSLVTSIYEEVSANQDTLFPNQVSTIQKNY